MAGLDKMKLNYDPKNCIISGGYGAGKSSYMNFIAGQYAFDFDRIKMTYRWLKEFDEKHGVKNRELPKHFVYSSDKMRFERVGNDALESHDFDPLTFGIQKYAPKGVKCKWFPFGSSLFIDEAYKYFPSGSGESNSLPQYISAGFKIERHRGLDIFMVSPRFIDIHKSIRDCSSGKFIVKKEVDITEKKAFIRWHIDSIPIGGIDAYYGASLADKHLHSTREIVTCRYDVFKLYNAFSHCDDFDEGLEVSDFVI